MLLHDSAGSYPVFISPSGVVFGAAVDDDGRALAFDGTQAPGRIDRGINLGGDHLVEVEFGVQTSIELLPENVWQCIIGGLNPDNDGQSIGLFINDVGRLEAWNEDNLDNGGPVTSTAELAAGSFHRVKFVGDGRASTRDSMPEGFKLAHWYVDGVDSTEPLTATEDAQYTTAWGDACVCDMLFNDGLGSPLYADCITDVKITIDGVVVAFWKLDDSGLSRGQ